MRRILLVDDNAAFAENLAEILTDAGFEADVAAGGEQALSLASATRYDLLVSDMRMPIMGGAELVHRIRQADPGLPAIVVTAYVHDDDLLAARHEGMLAVLPKPVPIDILIELATTARRDGLVALVEDDPAFADNLTEVLRLHGFAAVTAASVAETERLGDVRPFVALVDLRVPGGPDGAAMSRLAHRFPRLPLLVITAHADLAPPEPHAGFYRKPFATSALLEAIERMYEYRDG